MITALWGFEKSWKSTMALSWPKPLVHFDLDVGGFDRAIWRMDSTGITSKPYAIPIQMDKMLGAKQEGTTIRFPRQVIGYKEIWQQIVIDYVEACQDSEVQTIVMDSATMLWSICHTSLLQEKQEIQISAGMKVEDDKFRERLKPVEFPNDRMRSLVYTARSYRKNLVLTHYPRNIYKQMVDKKGDVVDYKSDEIEPDGFRDTQRLVDIVIWVYTYTNKEGNQVGAKITRCGLQGLGTTAVGLEIEPNYDGIVQLRERFTEAASDPSRS